jgi:CRP/FNR family cyclic AMP-dependent transcriptional regulator
MNLPPEKDEVCVSCEFEQDLGIMREIYFFSGLPLELIKVLAYLCTRETFRAGDYLLHQDDDDGRAFYLISGRARLLCEEEGTEHAVRDVEEGEFLGGLSLLGNMPRLFSMKAMTDTTCLVLTREKFNKAAERFPEIMHKITKAVVKGIRDWERKFFLIHAQHCNECQKKMGVSLI